MGYRDKHHQNANSSPAPGAAGSSGQQRESGRETSPDQQAKISSREAELSFCAGWVTKKNKKRKSNSVRERTSFSSTRESGLCYRENSFSIYHRTNTGRCHPMDDDAKDDDDDNCDENEKR